MQYHIIYSVEIYNAVQIYRFTGHASRNAKNNLKKKVVFIRTGLRFSTYGICVIK